MDGNGMQTVMPVSGGYGDGFGCGGGMWFMWLVVIFALMGGGGFGGWNNRGNALTQAECRPGLIIRMRCLRFAGLPTASQILLLH